MKAQINANGSRIAIRVFGRLAEEWVSELESFWISARKDHQNETIWVDLQHVTFIDEQGRSLLKRMHREGAKFRAAGLLTRQIVGQIISKRGDQ